MTDITQIEAQVKPFFLFLILLFIASMLGAAVSSHAKELPRDVKIEELDNFDGERVAVAGWVQGVVVSRGIRGSNFTSATLRNSYREVKVFALFPIIGISGNRAIVQGIYHKEGRYGGFLQENYIVLDTIVRDWEND